MAGCHRAGKICGESASGAPLMARLYNGDQTTIKHEMHHKARTDKWAAERPLIFQMRFTISHLPFPISPCEREIPSSDATPTRRRKELR